MKHSYNVTIKEFHLDTFGHDFHSPELLKDLEMKADKTRDEYKVLDSITYGAFAHKGVRNIFGD